MQGIFEELQRKFDRLEQEGQSLYIVNAGVMNHGKSSLFNSILGREEFAAQDVRTTVEERAVAWKDGVYLVDTPGLNAEDSDDAVAYAAYQKANQIVFVHTAKVGELHKNELEGLKRIAAESPSPEHFWKNFCMVMTFLDSERDEGNLSAIEAKCRADIKRVCGYSDFPIFRVSNSTYQKGMALQESFGSGSVLLGVRATLPKWVPGTSAAQERQKNILKGQKLVEWSGMQEFLSYLENRIPMLISDAKTIIRIRKEHARQNALQELFEAAARQRRQIDEKRQSIYSDHEEFLYEVRELCDDMSNYQDELKYLAQRYEELNNEVEALEARHAREVY